MANPPAMTDKKYLFCERYAVHRNAAQAAREAGYSEKAADNKGHALLQEKCVKDYLDGLTGMMTLRNKIDADYVLGNIVEVIEAVKLERDYRSWLKACELLGKHLKLFTDVQEHKFTINQMGRVTLGDADAIDGDYIVLDFDVGDEPNQLEHKE